MVPPICIYNTRKLNAAADSYTMFADLPLELVGEIAGKSRAAYHALVLAYPRFARSLTLGDRLDFAEKFGYDCRAETKLTRRKIVWYLDGKLHRIDGPAVEYTDGNKWWYRHGVLHRSDGPAVEHANGNRFWYLNDKRHRSNGPAIEWINGRRDWYLNGKRHRIDGPAIEFSDSKYWYINGEEHTGDETARECAISGRRWYINGSKLSETEFTAAAHRWVG